MGSSRIQPNARARERAFVLLALLRHAGIEPARVVGDPDGGVALYAQGAAGTARYARLLATNEGDLIATCVDHATDRSDVWAIEEAEMQAAIARIRSFVAG